MGALQPGLPSPVAILQESFIVVIDLKDCFFSIKLDPSDCERFAFSVPSPNLKRPYRRYHWKVLPQGMKNSPSLCQKFVDTALLNVRQAHPNAYICHFVDDILMACETKELALQLLQKTVKELNHFGLFVADEKIQLNPPFNYLGRIIRDDYIAIQQIEIRRDKLRTLNDFQKLLGSINWIRPFLKIPTGDLSPLFNILKGDTSPNSKRILTPESEKVLRLVDQAIQNSRLLQIDYSRPWQLLILKTSYTPTGCIW